jgi:hypothetical protein
VLMLFDDGITETVGVALVTVTMLEPLALL